MDSDPPVPPPSSLKKLKFTPKPPRRKKTAPVLPKSDGSDDDDDDAETRQELLRQVNERLGTQGSKVEKKSEAGSSSTRDQTKDGNSKNRSNLRRSSQKSVTSSSPNATKDGDIDKMLVDDESGTSSKSVKKYKQPWDPRSYYPITLPLRPLGSEDPEILNEQEFSEEKEYDETKINPAEELGFLNYNDEKHMIFFQFSEKLPLDKQTHRVPISSKGKEKVENSGLFKENSGSFKEDACCGLMDLPKGYIGKMLVYKSGAMKLKLGDVIFDVCSGTPRGCKEDAAVMNTETKNCCVLGPIERPAVVTPDLNSVLDNVTSP